MRLKTFLVACALMFAFDANAVLNPIKGTIDCPAADSTDFVPSFGQVVIDEDAYSRYIIQWMYWHDFDRLNWLWSNDDSTYEPDALFHEDTP